MACSPIYPFSEGAIMFSLIAGELLACLRPLTVSSFVTLPPSFCVAKRISKGECRNTLNIGTSM